LDACHKHWLGLGQNRLARIWKCGCVCAFRFGQGHAAARSLPLPEHRCSLSPQALEKLRIERERKPACSIGLSAGRAGGAQTAYLRVH